MGKALTDKKKEDKEDISPKKEEKRRKSWKRRKKEELDTLMFINFMICFFRKLYTDREQQFRVNHVRTWPSLKSQAKHRS